MSEFFGGKISNIRKYNRALTEDEIKTLFRVATGRQKEFFTNGWVYPKNTEFITNEFGQHYVIESGKWTMLSETKKEKWSTPAVYLNAKKVLRPGKLYTIQYLSYLDRGKRDFEKFKFLNSLKRIEK